MSRKFNFFLTLFLTFILMLTFPTLLTIALYHNMNAIIKEDVRNSSQAMLKQVSLMIDSRLHEVEQLAVQLSFHPKVLQMLHRQEALGPPAPQEFLDIMNALASYSSVNEFIRDRYVYFQDQDAVVTPYVKSQASTFYRLYHHYETLDERQWLDFLQRSGNEAGFLPAMNIAGRVSGGTERMITYSRPIPYGEPGPSKGAVVFMINEQQIRSMLDNLEGAHQATILIADKEGRLLTQSGSGERYRGIEKDLDAILHSTLTEYAESVSGERMMVTKFVSPETGWHYISLVPHSIMMAKVNRVEKWALTLLGICILFGLTGAYFLSRRLYSPIRSLVASILKRDNKEGGRGIAEFSLIEETLSNTWKSEAALQELVDRQAPVIQSNFLNRLLKGLVDPEALNAESLRFMGIRFESDRFAVIVMEVDDFLQLVRGETEQQWAMIRFIISNISQELLGERHEVYVVETDLHRLVLLVNRKPGDSADRGLPLEAAIGEIKSVIELKFNIRMSIGVSEIREQVRAVPGCYTEALEALEYRIVKGKSSVTYYREIDQARDRARYYYPLDVEMRLTNAIRAGDFEQADQLLKHIEQMNFHARQISLEMGRLLYFNMMSTLIKIWNDASERVQGLFADGFEPLQRLSACTTLAEMQEQIRLIYQKICDSVVASQRDPGAVLAEQIAGYIEDHYAEHSLSLNSLADQFRLTPQYLSGFFKKHTGYNLADYMTRVRVERAKTLLGDDSLSLNRIAELVGYAKDAGLIRVFKKYVGVTPGKYREHMKD
ncbi:helix-turn-helix domain-containing protein [Paenibacillus cymbidii]|uniref:helix-turn-helix domain-containing protein n=1 Tax=Paenibacillus cymbidii TaxID=1639034 RepID=UPI001080E58C|nr:helix-turn-helix domain-containing protein [Paenibacillus cymbidii]